MKWRLPNLLIDRAIHRARLDKALLTKKLFHHQPTVRALAMTGRSIARYGLSAPQRFCAPLMVVWNMTQACNLRCVHCYQNATAKPAADELTLAEKLDAVDQMGAAGVPFLAIAGGEPLVSKDLWPVLERARERRIHVSLATNGTLLTPATVARLIAAGVKYVEVSIDSLEADEHDRFRSHPGAWERAVRGIRNSVAGGMRTGLATCFTSRTVARVDEMVEFAISLGCSTFSHFNFIPLGRGRDMVDADLTPRQREWLMRKLVGHLQEGRIGVISTAPQFGERVANDDSFPLCRRLRSGRCYCAIEPNGDITPCVYISTLKVGNLREQSFAEIWDCALFGVSSDRSDRGGHCVVCEDRAYCGGCRARAFAYTGNIRGGDPGCRHNEELWEELAEAK